jgi:very-short-patch-repair endonuclease
MTKGQHVQIARTLRRNQTDVERKLWQHLRNRRLENIKFARQETIGSYIADFCARDLKLVIELDGGQHGTDDGIAADALRTEVIERFGYRVVRFWNGDVMENIDGVLETIRHEILLSTIKTHGFD